MKTEQITRHPLRATVLGVLALVASQTAFAWPDLAVTKTAPAFASVNDLITYTLVYTNQGAITATGVTLTDVLPPQLSPNTNSLGSGSLSGNTITWSLGSITIKKGGTITFQARVNSSAPASGSVTNLARIQSTNADENTNNNSSMAITRIVSISPLTNQTACVGGCAVFCTSVIGGTSPNCYSYTFQWYKGSGLLAGKTGTSLVLTNLSLNDAGTYTVVATGSYGGHLTNSATLTVTAPLTIVTPPANQSVCVGGTATFTVGVTGSPISYQWYKGSVLLTGRTTNSLVLANVATGDAATYSVVVSGDCGTVQTNSATLTVTTPLTIVTPPANQSVCVGGTATFTVGVTGSPVSYQWYKGSALLTGRTTNSLVLANVATGDAATYSVVVSGGCGTVQTNSATLSVNASTTTSPLESLVRNVGDTALFTTTPSGTGPFTYVWKKNGVIISVQTSNILVLSNLGYGDEGTYEVDVTGACNTATQSASLHINLPPTVTIFSPTNGTVFVAPASFTLFANAQDPDGTISKVDFYSATNKIGETTNVVFYSTNITAYALGLTNLPAGTNIFTAIATDNNGATGTSAPVSITILSAPPLTIVSSMTYDPLTDLFEETVRVSNPTYSTYQAVRVHITNLQNGTVVWNPSGSTNGIPYVQSQSAVMPDSFVDLVIEYYSPLRVAPNPVLSAELVQTNSGGSAALFGVPQHVTRLAMLSNKTFMVEFLSASNHLYSIEYSSDLKNWQSAVPSIAGDGTWIQWIDNGQPKTESSPAGTSMRFYKVILLQ